MEEIPNNPIDHPENNEDKKVFESDSKLLSSLEQEGYCEGEKNSQKKLSPIWGIVSCLLLLIGLLIAYSYHFDIVVNGISLKKPTIKEYFQGLDKVSAKEKDSLFKKDTSINKTVPVIIKNDKDTLQSKESFVKIVPYQLDTNPQRILMIGESMIEQLYLNFLKYGKYNGHYVKAKIWYGSNLIWWSEKDTIKKLIALYKPTFIVVSIGSNELFLPKITERASYVEKIRDQLEGHKFIWVGPPIPKRDYGIDSMIRTIIGKERYFTSKNMTFKRRRDGVHPRPESAKIWADSIAVWIRKVSIYPIKMDKPVIDTTKKSVPLIKRKSKKENKNESKKELKKDNPNKKASLIKIIKKDKKEEMKK